MALPSWIRDEVLHHQARVLLAQAQLRELERLEAADRASGSIGISYQTPIMDAEHAIDYHHARLNEIKTAWNIEHELDYTRLHSMEAA